MLFNILKENFDILSPLDPIVLEDGPVTRSYIFAKKNNQTHITFPVAKTKLPILFECYGISIPTIINSLTSSSEYVFVDVTTIQTPQIKIYIRKKEVNPELYNQYPCINEVDMTQLMGLSFLVDINSSIVEYKYYFFNSETAEYTIYRFDGSGNFINQDIETSRDNITESDLVAFDSRLYGINATLNKSAELRRVGYDQSYVVIQENFNKVNKNSIQPTPFSGFNVPEQIFTGKD